MRVDSMFVPYCISGALSTKKIGEILGVRGLAFQQKIVRIQSILFPCLQAEVAVEGDVVAVSRSLITVSLES